MQPIKMESFMTKKPWERRLKDLSHLLKCCIDTYFDPELFRLNLNQFLQTARTVTFIIQKNKNQIIGCLLYTSDAADDIALV